VRDRLRRQYDASRARCIRTLVLLSQLGDGPRGRIAAIENQLVTRSQWAVQISVVKAQGPFCCLTDRRLADKVKVHVRERKVLGPGIKTRIEQAYPSPPEPKADAVSLS